MGAFLTDIVRILDTIAPPALAEPWDNVGLQLGDPGLDVKAVWVALDPSPAVIDAACAGRIDLLVTHHPLFFRPLTRIDLQSPIGATIGQALQHRLAVYSLHTNLDAVPQGLNDLLAQRLELQRVRPLIANPAVAGNRHGIGRVGLLSRPRRLSELALSVKRRLGVERVRIAGDPQLRVQRVAVSTGSGSGVMPHFLQSDAQVLISGDLRYHDARDAEAAHRGLLDVGHFHSEQFMKNSIVQRLGGALARKRLSVRVDACPLEKDPFTFL
ncbi:MAG: Nif3-like dinuclear metal center hexameric protein [Deltaproteobacteria bacterium]|nr:Nif3-like dinuclear metal center hexameric protein [Deltaproteobacteria bacterium]